MSVRSKCVDKPLSHVGMMNESEQDTASTVGAVVMNESEQDIASTVVMDQQRIYDKLGRSYSKDQVHGTHTHTTHHTD